MRATLTKWEKGLPQVPKDKVDNYLITINVAVVVGYFFVFLSSISSAVVKWLVLLSFTLFTASLLLLLWFQHRYPKREKLLNELKEKTVKKFSHRIHSYIDEIAVPLERLSVRDEIFERLDGVKTKEDYARFRTEIDTEIEELKKGKTGTLVATKSKANDYVIDSFLEHMMHDSRDDYAKAFREPLNEKHAKVKHVIDRAAFRSRRHIFAAASVLLFFSIIIEVVSQK